MAAICRGSLAVAKNAFKLKTVPCLSACMNHKVGTIQCKCSAILHRIESNIFLDLNTPNPLDISTMGHGIGHLDPKH